MGKNTLRFATTSSWIEWANGTRLEFPLTKVTKGTFPPGSEWARNPIPACHMCDSYDECGPGVEPTNAHDRAYSVHAWCSGYCNGQGQQDTTNGLSKCPAGKESYPALAGLSGFGMAGAPGVIDRPWPWSIVDKVKVPNDLPSGDYLLSWRWDCEQSAQVWQNCADVRIEANDVGMSDSAYLDSERSPLVSGAAPMGPSHCQRLGLAGTAADVGVCMPFAGLGTGSVMEYTENSCGFFCNLTQSWYKIGGRRTDSSDSYGNEVAIGIALQKSGIPREEVFITSKVGPPHWNFPLGYNSTFRQINEILKNYSTSYVDLLLIHQPTPWDPPLPGWPTSDPECELNSNMYDEAACRLITWRAMLEIWKSGKAKAVGVSNWNVTHIQAIKDAGLLLPSVNQVNQNPKQPQVELRKFCAEHNIAIQAYGSYGGSGTGGSLLKLPLIQEIAEAHNVSSAQVILNWQWRHNISSHPGFKPCPLGAQPCVPGPQPPIKYLEESLNFIDGINLGDEEMQKLDKLGSFEEYIV